MSVKKTKARLFLGSGLAQDGQVALSPAQAHYLRDVMRAGPGDHVKVFNGRDGEWLAGIERIGKGKGVLRLDECVRAQREEPGPWLLFAPLKKTPMDFLIEKSVELGCAVLRPVFTDFTAVRRVNSERMRAAAVEASEQCGRLSVPEIKGAVSLDEALEDWPVNRRLFVMDETGAGRPIKKALETGGWEGRPPPAFLSGPEGGFSASELDALGNLAFVSRIGMGPRILRAETAVLAALACWQAFAGDGNKTIS